MSLFKAKDFWSSTCGQEETFDGSSLLVSDLLGDGIEYLLVGSHQGKLRLFSPFTEAESKLENGFSPTDLLLETDLENPILQIETGKFVSGSKTKSIAILHPRTLAVYNFSTVTGSTEHGDQSQLFMVYEHHLKRAAYNMIIGGFGGVEGRDFVCIQGLDGTLMFYEQETLTLTRQLPNFLLPSPFVYVSHTDSFIMLSSNWNLESYRYQSLGEENPASKPVPSWIYNLGESINEMYCLNLTTTEAAIIITTDRNLYGFRETGVLRFCKRLQYIPLCCHIFSKGEPTIMSLVVTDTNSLMIYEQTTLKWSAQLPITPVALSRGTFKSLKGCIVILSEIGELLCCYLGTEPTIFIPPAMAETNTTITELESKLSTVQHQIATYSQAARVPISRPDIKLTAKIWPISESDISCKLEITVKASTLVHDIHINLSVEHPLVVTPKSHFIQNLDNTEQVDSVISIANSHTVPWDLEVHIIAVFLTSDDGCGSAETTIFVPPQLILELAPPVKDLETSLSLSVSQPVIIPTIFPEFSADSWSETGSTEFNAGFRYKNTNVIFSITLNKTQLKYRIDTNMISCLAVPLTILAKKLDKKSLKTNQHRLAMTELLEAIDNNIELRNQIRDLQDVLKQGTAQMRAVQRRLLSKMRDKTPTDLSALVELISYTNELILEAAHRMDTANNDLNENCTRLGSLIKLTLLLTKLGGASNEDTKSLYDAISNVRHQGENQGWAEVTETALNFLLKTSLARTMRDQYMPEVKEDNVVKNSSTLKNYMALALERVLKIQKREERAVSPIIEGEEEHKTGVHSSRPTHYKDYDAEVNKLFQEAMSEED